MGEDKKVIQRVEMRGWKKLFSKKWAFPAMYMGLAAIILATMMWYQKQQEFSLSKEQLGLDKQQAEEKQTAEATAQKPIDAMPVSQMNGKPLMFPVKQDVKVEQVMGYFDETADKKAQQATLVQYENSYWPNTGIDIAATDKKAFEVIASADGKVKKAEKNPLLGYQVEVEHANGLETVYASLDEMKVKVGDSVTKGTTLGVAGRNVFEKDMGIHLHFEVRKNGEAMKPDVYMDTVTK